MKFSKKVLSLLLASAMALSLAACGSSTTSTADTSAASAGSAASAADDTAGGDAAAAPAADALTYLTADPADTSLGVSEANLDYASADLSGKTIGYVTINSSAPWGGLVGTSMQEYAESVGAKVNALDAATEIDKVAEYSQQMIDAGVDALVIFGGDPAANSDIAKTAADAGIPVFMAGLDVSAEGRENVAAVVGPNQYEAFVDIANQVVEDNGTSDNLTVVQINGVPFLEDYIERTSGFHNTISAYSNYDISTEPANAYSSRTDAKTYMEQFIAANSDIDILIGYDDDLTMGGVQAIEEAGLTDQIKVYSFTGQKDAIQAVIDGKMVSTTLNKARDIGAGLVTAMDEYFKNGSCSSYYLTTPLVTITKDNAEQYLSEAEF